MEQLLKMIGATSRAKVGCSVVRRAGSEAANAATLTNSGALSAHADLIIPLILLPNLRGGMEASAVGRIVVRIRSFSLLTLDGGTLSSPWLKCAVSRRSREDSDSSVVSFDV